MPAHVKHWFFISREIWALSYNACSYFGNELNPETNLAAFSLNIANNTPIITNGITKTPHSQNPIFIVYSSFTNTDYHKYIFFIPPNQRKTLPYPPIANSPIFPLENRTHNLWLYDYFSYKCTPGANCSRSTLLAYAP